MDKSPGTYALILYAKAPVNLEIGKLGLLRGQPGYYLYCGSAFGPGGLAARLKHHRKIAKRPHWHIDYLHKKLVLSHIWYSHEPIKREHDWAQLLGTETSASFPQLGFGSSDCKCLSHLIYLPYTPILAVFQHKLNHCRSNYDGNFPILEIYCHGVSRI
ncbi:MAG: GIY-YIG nuclease family protein [Anaerolineae bacterium]|nr:GIY-YIG nuclease family protein [Anaerolineae bacterium]